MLQDLKKGRLENEFIRKTPRQQDRVICFRDSSILLHRGSDDTLTLPQAAQVRIWAESRDWTSWREERFLYAFAMEGEDYYLWMGNAGQSSDAAFCYEAVRPLRQMVSKEVCFAIMTGWHLYVWYRNNRFCGRCGAKTVLDEKERALRCSCGNLIFPKISPAVIVAVTDGDRLLLSRYAGRSYTSYALLAGYTEIGETLEQTIRREVMEEVGLSVTNIRYYKSQPWGVDGNILMGFYCDLDGADSITLDREELSHACFYDRHSLPAKDDGISLTREMIRIFEEGREPR